VSEQQQRCSERIPLPKGEAFIEPFKDVRMSTGIGIMQAYGVITLHGRLYEWCWDWLVDRETQAVKPLGSKYGCFRMTVNRNPTSYGRLTEAADIIAPILVQWFEQNKAMVLHWMEEQYDECIAVAIKDIKISERHLTDKRTKVAQLREQKEALSQLSLPITA
jgi:hypothetical protein